MTTQGHTLKMSHVQYNDYKKIVHMQHTDIPGDVNQTYCSFSKMKFNGILILRGILKLNKSISSKKPLHELEQMFNQYPMSAQRRCH